MESVMYLIYVYIYGSMESVMYLLYVQIFYGSMGNLKIKPDFSVLYIWTEEKEYIKIFF